MKLPSSFSNHFLFISLVLPNVRIKKKSHKKPPNKQSLRGEIQEFFGRTICGRREKKKNTTKRCDANFPHISGSWTMDRRRLLYDLRGNFVVFHSLVSTRPLKNRTRGRRCFLRTLAIYIFSIAQKILRRKNPRKLTKLMAIQG